MARVYNPNFDGFRKMANGPEIRAALAEVATKGKGIAEGLAQDFRITGDYADSFEVRDETIQWQGRFSGPRAAAQLVNTSDHAVAVEFGNEHVPHPHHVLGRTAAALRE